MNTLHSTSNRGVHQLHNGAEHKRPKQGFGQVQSVKKPNYKKMKEFFFPQPTS